MTLHAENFRPSDDLESFPLRDLSINAAPVTDPHDPFRPCDMCGKTFYKASQEWQWKIQSAWYDKATNRYRRGKNGSFLHYFCSYGCMRKAQKMAERFKKEKAPQKVCESCGRTFVSYHGTARFCSIGCRYDAQGKKANAKRVERQSAGGLDTWRDDEGRICHHMACQSCGKIFVSHATNRKFCSDACREAEHYRQTKERRAELREQFKQKKPSEEG